MSDPLALLPLALAAGGGRIHAATGAEYELQQLVAAGLTLLQRSAPLVRALVGRRSAILLPPSPAFFVALAASDGRGALLLDPLALPADIAFQCADANVGAVFTSAALAPFVPHGMTTVLLDDSPRRARVVCDGAAREVDLGTHHGLSLEGERDVPGRDEEAAIVYAAGPDDTPRRATFTHADLLANGRSTMVAMGNVPGDRVLACRPFAAPLVLATSVTAPLLAGATVTPMERFDPVVAARLFAGGITEVVGAAADYDAMLSALGRLGAPRTSGTLRLCLCIGELPPTLAARWRRVTNVELRRT